MNVFRYLQGTTRNTNMLDVLVLVWSWHSPADLKRDSFWMSVSVGQSSYKTARNFLWNTGGVCANFLFVSGAFTDWGYRPGRAQRGFVEAVCRKLFMAFVENQGVDVGWWAKKWSLPVFFFFWQAFHLLFLTVFILFILRGEIDTLMFAKSLCSERDACQMKESLLSLVSSPRISPCLLTSCDLWPACTASVEKVKDLKLAVLDVAGWRCRKE